MSKPADASEQLLDAMDAMGRGVAGADDAMFQSLAELNQTQGSTARDALAYLLASEQFLVCGASENHERGTNAGNTASTVGIDLLQKAIESLEDLEGAPKARAEDSQAE